MIENPLTEVPTPHTAIPKTGSFSIFSPVPLSPGK
jgi:hypothetical protein